MRKKKTSGKKSDLKRSGARTCSSQVSSDNDDDDIDAAIPVSNAIVYPCDHLTCKFTCDTIDKMIYHQRNECVNKIK